MEFNFINKPGMHRDGIIFAKFNEIFKLNLESEEVTTFYKFKEPLFR